MDTDASARRALEFGRIPKIAGAQAVLVGILVLAGWQLDLVPLKSILPGLVAMNPATAVAFILSGVALLLLRSERRSPQAVRIAAFCSAAVVLIGASRFLGALSGWDLGLDRLLFPARLGADPFLTPNRMAPNTALNFLFVGAALLASQRATRAGLRAAQFLVLAPMLLSTLAVIGYSYGVRALYSVATYIPMALNTAMAFLLLCVGILFRRPGEGLTAIFIGDDSGGLMVRRLLPLSLLILSLFGWLELRGRLGNLYDASFGVSLHAAASIVVLTIVIWMNAWALRRAEAERNRATKVLRATHAALEKRVAKRTRDLSASNEDLRGEIAQRCRAEASLIKLTRAVEQTADLVAITDREGLIEYVNPAFERHTGFTLDELSGETLPALRPDPRDPASREEIRETILSGGVFRGVTLNRRKSGKLFHEEMTVSPLRDPDGTISHFVSTGHDVSDRLLLEEQLRQVQKMEAVGRLAGGVAHDFNNLLTAIMGFGQLMKANFGPDDPARRDVEEILLAAARGASLTRQLLLFSRQQVVEFQVLDLNATIASMDKMLPRLVGEDIDVASAPAANPVHVWGDAGQLEQVLMNLAVNARDAMPEGGKLTIEASTVDLGATYAETHPSVKPGLYAMLAVSDTGTGMTPGVRAHLFEPFFTTKEVGKGTGLGLSTVHGIVSNSGGHVDVYTQPGQGTTFKVYLPLTEPTAKDAAARSVELGSCEGSETVLLVEDEEPLRRMMRSVLALQGYTVLVATDGSEAIGICERRDQPIDLLVTDVVMPLMNGPDLARQAVLIRPDLRVLYMSGYTDRALVHQELRGAATAFLQKPFMPEALARKIREVLDQPLRNVA